MTHSSIDIGPLWQFHLFTILNGRIKLYIVEILD